MTYTEESYLQLSGIQHYRFCRRQWALIHIEGLWAENYLTADGHIVHKRVHDSDFVEKRGDTVITRGVSVFSSSLGVSGQCDALEFHRSENGIPMKKHEGLWQPYPVEYKRGSPQEYGANELQLCAQAMCLEEMLCCEIPCGALYYNEIRRRVEVEFTSELRNEVQDTLSEMHSLFERRHTPKCKASKSCKACSMAVHCLPGLSKTNKVSEYIKRAKEESS